MIVMQPVSRGDDVVFVDSEISGELGCSRCPAESHERCVGCVPELDVRVIHRHDSFTASWYLFEGRRPTPTQPVVITPSLEHPTIRCELADTSRSDRSQPSGREAQAVGADDSV